jgi:putative membrane protein
MTGFILRWIVGALGLWLASRIVPGIHIRGLETLLLAALLLGLVNAIVRPVVVFLTLPLTLVTLGLFLLVINAALFWLVSVFLSGFVVHGFMAALGGAIVTGLVSWFASGFIGAAGKIERIGQRR